MINKDNTNEITKKKKKKKKKKNTRTAKGDETVESNHSEKNDSQTDRDLWENFGKAGSKIGKFLFEAGKIEKQIKLGSEDNKGKLLTISSGVFSIYLLARNLLEEKDLTEEQINYVSNIEHTLGSQEMYTDEFKSLINFEELTPSE